jgi:hypothetical protein
MDHLGCPVPVVWVVLVVIQVVPQNLMPDLSAVAREGAGGV